jgi:predicted transcriptional regulator
MEPVNENSPRPSDIQLCEQALAAARPWGLEAEVMWSALNAAAEANEHGKNFEQVLDEAMAEWDL